jgi:hypothetical protein
MRRIFASLLFVLLAVMAVPAAGHKKVAHQPEADGDE